MTLTVKCACRITPSGVEFRLDDDPPEDEMCELRVNFDFTQFYPPERDVGAGITWNAGPKVVELQAPLGPWRPLDRMIADAARNFLETHCRADLDEAEREAALEIYYGD
jgi:hypothetical protein